MWMRNSCALWQQYFIMARCHFRQQVVVDRISMLLLCHYVACRPKTDCVCNIQIGSMAFHISSVSYCLYTHQREWTQITTTTTTKPTVIKSKYVCGIHQYRTASILNRLYLIVMRSVLLRWNVFFEMDYINILLEFHVKIAMCRLEIVWLR